MGLMCKGVILVLVKVSWVDLSPSKRRISECKCKI